MFVRLKFAATAVVIAGLFATTPAQACYPAPPRSDIEFQQKVDAILDRIESPLVIEGFWRTERSATRRETRLEREREAEGPGVTQIEGYFESYGSVAPQQILRGPQARRYRVWYTRILPGTCQPLIPADGQRGTYYLKPREGGDWRLVAFDPAA